MRDLVRFMKFKFSLLHKNEFIFLNILDTELFLSSKTPFLSGRSIKALNMPWKHHLW